MVILTNDILCPSREQRMLITVTAAEIANVLTAAAVGCLYIHGAILSVTEIYPFSTAQTPYENWH